MIYFHFCSNYKSKTTQQINTAVVKLLNDYKNRSSLKGIGRVSSFTSGIYVLKNKNPFFDIIIEERNVKFKEELLTVYFLRGFKNKVALQEYVEIRDGKWLNNNPIDPSEIEEFKNQLLEKEKKSSEIPDPPNDLVNWQNGYYLKVDYDIYESEDWTKYALSSSKSHGMQVSDVKLFGIALKEILKNNNQLISVLQGKENYQKCIVEHNEVGILYFKIKINSNFYYLLIDGANTNNQKDHWQRILSSTEFENLSLGSMQDISSYSVKAYPSWSVSNNDLWEKIQKNNEFGNLSLLPEQTRFLKNFKFPKYINGQAGSGKSTMLYYLFSNIYYYKCAGEIKGDIVFLTENKKLLEYTISSVYELILNNPEFDLSEEHNYLIDLQECFSPFKEFLLQFVPNDNNSFDPDKYLNFSKFKLLYQESNIPEYVKNKYSAELVWFTITTYVNGYSLDYHITSDNYIEKMPSEGKDLISHEDLKGIEKNIIKPFYNKLITNNGYWDKIQLIKFLNKNVRIEKTFDVIFCDEAQDFSRIELEFILRLSSYARYNLKKVEQFPVVFAGDALQTVNPTGFRSQVLTSMLYNELTNKKTGYNLDSQSLEFTPTFNYRSSQAIVNVANAVQYYRKDKLNSDIKSPQRSKRPVLFKNENLNVFIDYSTLINDDQLITKIEYKTIIVPVNNDEIEKFKESHPILKRYKGIISAVDSKGLDFNEVAIFGFGDFYIEKEKKLYEKRYFFNKLYVAITRAKSELVIIDSLESKESFWKLLIDEYISSSWFDNSLPNLKKFEDIIVFDTNEVIQSSTNILTNDALRQKEQGEIEGNISLLKLASNHFLKLGNKKEYFLCLGKIEEIKGNYLNASKHYLRKEAGSEGVQNAINNYWRYNYCKELIDVKDDLLLNNRENKIKYLFSKLMVNESISSSEIDELLSFDFQIRRITENLNWKSKLVEKLYNCIKDELSDERYILNVSELIREISDDEHILLKLAHKYYDIKKYKYAVKIYEDFNIEDDVYVLSKLELAYLNDQYEEIIIYNGRLLFEYNYDRINISKQIVNYYNQFVKQPYEINNIYFFLYSYLSHLIIFSELEKILDLSQNVENLFNQANRSVELAHHYFILLEKDNIDPKLINFILDRWVINLNNSGATLKEINAKYKLISKRLNLKYIEYTAHDLKSIPIHPKVIDIAPPNHFSSIEVRNFKRFKDIEIENLGQFNLIVGDNNIGKTSLLESFLFTNDIDKFIERLAFSFIERDNIFPDKEKDSDSENLYFKIKPEFITNFFNTNSDQKIISYKLFHKRYFWEYNFIYDKEARTDKNSINLYGKVHEKVENLNYRNSLTIPFIPFGKGYSRELSKIYDENIRPNRKLEAELIESLRLFIPKIQRIYVNQDGGIEIRDDGFDEDKPLNQYGEGVNKLFKILLSLTIHKGDKLLIDEIDAGIHFSKFKQFWRIILKVAKQNHTQIFATTHNEECIKYFNEVLNEKEFTNHYQDVSRVIQMKLVNDLTIRSFEFKSFNMAFEDDIEIR